MYLPDTVILICTSVWQLYINVDSHPCHQANNILPIIPVPSFNIHVIAAAKGVAVDSPTPTPLMIECVVRVPLIVLAKALTWFVDRDSIKTPGHSLKSKHNNKPARYPKFGMAHNLHEHYQEILEVKRLL